jgi:hypothetical protein
LKVQEIRLVHKERSSHIVVYVAYRGESPDRECGVSPKISLNVFGDFQCAKRAKGITRQNGLLLLGILPSLTELTWTPFCSDKNEKLTIEAESL